MLLDEKKIIIQRLSIPGNPVHTTEAANIVPKMKNHLVHVENIHRHIANGRITSGKEKFELTFLIKNEIRQAGRRHSFHFNKNQCRKSRVKQGASISIKNRVGREKVAYPEAPYGNSASRRYLRKLLYMRYGLRPLIQYAATNVSCFGTNEKII